MRIMDRISIVLKANIHDMLDRAEDPEKMLSQLIRDMEDTYKSAESQVAESMALEKKLEREYLAAQALVEQALAQATQAVEQGRDDLARTALAVKLQREQRVARLKDELEAQSEAVMSLRSQLNALLARIEDARQQKAALLARQKRLEAEQTIRRSVSELRYSDSAFLEFDRLKDYLDVQEDIIAAAKSLEAERTGAPPVTSDAVEIELAALKARLGKL